MAEEQFKTPTLLDKMSAEVTPATSPLLNFLSRNAKLIVVLSVAGLMAAGGYGVYSWQQRQTAENARDALARVLVIEDDAARLAGLKDFLPTAPAGLVTSANLAIASAALRTHNYADAVQAWDALSKDPKDLLYVTAMIGKAEALALQGKHADALAVLESIVLPQGSEAVNMVNALIVTAAEQTGDLKKALAVCEKLIPGMAERSPEEAEYWRQKAASLRAAAQS